MDFTVTPEFSTGATAIVGVVAVYLTLVDPWLGRRRYLALAEQRDTEPRALTRFYGFLLGTWAAALVLAAVALLLSPGLSGADLGLRMPERPAYTYVAIAVFLAMIVASGRQMRRLARQDKHVPGRDAVAAMLPRTPAERRLAAAVAVTDGVAAEFVYRGLLIAFGVGALGLNVYVAAALSLVIYALAGWYQGRTGVGMFALFGLACTVFYLFTGSLLLPIVFHVVVTVRDMVFLPAPDRMPEQGRAGATA